MDFEMPFNITNFDMDFFTIGVGIFLILIGILYYAIFHKHHKKNKVDFSELISLLAKFYSLTIISIIMIILGIYCIISVNSYKEDRSQVVMGIILGIGIISGTIINYIFYIKRNLKDYEPVERELVKKRMIQVGEILELIFFIIFMTMPIWRIPKFIDVFENTKQLIIELLRAFGLSIASIILLFSLNPINIKQKIDNFLNKEKKQATKETKK